MAVSSKYTTVDAHFLYKFLTVARLKQILSELDDSDELVPNTVGNLSVFRLSTDVQENGEPVLDIIGYIDIGGEELEFIHR